MAHRTVTKFNRVAEATAASGLLDQWAQNTGVPRADLDAIITAARVYADRSATPSDQSRARKTLLDYSRKHSALCRSILRSR